MARGTALKIAAAIVVVGSAVLLVLYRASLHNWPWQGPPARMTWCGRHYDRSPGPPWTEKRVGHHLTTVVFRAPPIIGRQVLTDLSPRQLARNKRNRETGGACGLGLFRRTGDGRFTLYELSGGP